MPQDSKAPRDPNLLVLEERNGAIVTIRLNRPDKLNALNVELGDALVHALLSAVEDRSVRCVVVTGAGRAFCAGGDIAVLRDLRQRKDSKEFERLLKAGKEIVMAMATMPKIVVTAVNGPAAGGGMNLALAGDIRIASDQAKFAESFVQIGLFPDFGGTYLLPRIVGAARASELFYTAQLLSADDALKLGIVSRVIPQAEFEAKRRSSLSRLRRGVHGASRREAPYEFRKPQGTRSRSRRGDSSAAPLLRIGRLPRRAERLRREAQAELQRPLKPVYSASRPLPNFLFLTT